MASLSETSADAMSTAQDRQNGGALTQASDRRAHRRLAVTLSAQVQCTSQRHRVEILDVSLGGLLLRFLDASRPVIGETVRIDAALIGTIHVEIIAVSHLGVHAKLKDASPRYDAGVRRLSVIATTWSG